MSLKQISLGLLSLTKLLQTTYTVRTAFSVGYVLMLDSFAERIPPAMLPSRILDPLLNSGELLASNAYCCFFFYRAFIEHRYGSRELQIVPVFHNYTGSKLKLYKRLILC